MSFSSAELHRLELRSDAVDKQTKGLVEMLESTVWRRDAMAEKAAARRAALTCSASSMGTPKTPQLGCYSSVMRILRGHAQMTPAERGEWVTQMWTKRKVACIWF